MTNPTQTQAWQNLIPLTQNAGAFSPSPKGEGKGINISLDLSKSLISDEIWDQLFTLAKEQKIEEWRDKMVAGEAINHTENRAVGHMWLRGGEREDVNQVLNHMQHFVKKTHDSQ